MDDQRKTDNVVKIFVESLKESKDFPDSKIDSVSRGIVQVLASLYDPSKKEFRDKVNVLKMKLKGSRNNSARAALLQDKISPADFVNLPQENYTIEYFDNLISGGQGQSTASSNQAPPSRVNNQMMSSQIRGNAPPPRGASRPGGVRVMPPQANNFRPVQMPPKPQENEESGSNEQETIENNTVQHDEQPEVQKQQEVVLPAESKQAQESNKQAKNPPVSQKHQPEEQPQKISQNTKPIKNQPPTVHQEAQQEEKPVHKQSVGHNEEESEQNEQQAPPIKQGAPLQGRTQVQAAQNRLKQHPAQKKTQQIVANETQPAQQQQQQVKLPPQEDHEVEQKPITKNQQTQQQQDTKQSGSIHPPVQKSVQNVKQVEEPPKQQQQKVSQPQPVVQPVVEQQKRKEESQKQQQPPVKNTPPTQTTTPLATSQTQSVKQGNAPPQTNTKQQVQQPSQQQVQKQQQTQVAEAQQKQTQQKAPVQSQLPPTTVNQQQRQVQKPQQENTKVVQQQRQQQQPQQQQLHQQQQQNRVVQNQSQSDEEGECEDAHMSQLKSQLDDFKKMKQQMQEQIEAEYSAHEQVLGNLSNDDQQDDYSYYDDDESYENANKVVPHKQAKQNQDAHTSDEYEVHQKNISPIPPQKQNQPTASQTAKQQVEQKKDQSHDRLKQLQDKHQRDSSHEYELHQQIEHQKHQEEIQKKQMQKITSAPPPQISVKAAPQTAHQQQHPQQHHQQQQQLHAQHETQFAASHSSKQTHSKQKLDEMSDFEKIELNPVLRNEEFEDQNEEDVVHHIHQDNKNTNFDQKNGGYANPFKIQVPKQTHQRNISGNVVNQEDQESIDRLKNVQQQPVTHQSPAQLPPQRNSHKKRVKGPEGDEIEVTNSDNENQEYDESDNMQNILQGLTDQEQSKKSLDKESVEEQQEGGDFVQEEEQEQREKSYQQQEEEEEQEIQVEIDVDAEQNEVKAEDEIQDNYEQEYQDQRSEKEKSRSSSISDERQKKQSRKVSAHATAHSHKEEEHQKHHHHHVVQENIHKQEYFEEDNNNLEIEAHHEEIGVNTISSAQNARLSEENKQLKAKLRQFIQEQVKREEGSKRALIEKDKKNKLLEQQIKETQEEIMIIKKYLDEIIEENSKYKQQYEEMKLSFGKNEHHLREELGSLKHKIKIEYTNEIQQLRSINQSLTQNNDYLKNALDSLAIDLEQKDVIIKNLTFHSSEQVNRSYQNINSKSLNYSSANTVQVQSTITQQKASNNLYVPQQQPQQQQQHHHQQQIQQQQQQKTNFTQQEAPEEVIDVEVEIQQEGEDDNQEGIEIHAHAELEVDLQDNQENDAENYDGGQQEEQNQNLNQGEEEELQNEQEDANNEINDDEEGAAQEDKQDQDLQDDDGLDQQAQQHDHQIHNQNEYENQYNNSQSSPVYQHQTENKNTEQFDDAENFFDQLLPGTQQTPPIIPQTEPKKQTVQQITPKNNSSQNNTKKVNSTATAGNNNLQSQPPVKKDSLQEQIMHLGGVGEDIHNQSNSNFFDLNSIPNVPTTSELRSSHNNKITGSKQPQQQRNMIDLNPAENTFFSTENDFFNTVTSDKFNTSNISAIPNPFNTNNFFNQNFTNPFHEPQSTKSNTNAKGSKKVRNTAANNLFN